MKRSPAASSWIALMMVVLPLCLASGETGVISRARAAYNKERFEDACKAFREATGRFPRDLAPWEGLFRASLWSERYSDVAAAAERINQLRQNDPRAPSWLVTSWRLFTKAAVREKAIGLTQAGRYDEAALLYRGLLSLEPHNRGILHDLEWVLWRAQRYPEAVEAAGECAALRPEEAAAWNVLGKVFIAANEREEALRAYRKSLVIDQSQPLVQQAIGKLYVDLRDFETAARYLGDIQKLTPEVAVIYPSLAKAQFYQEQYAASAQTWAKAVALFPDNVDYKVAAAQALYFSGKKGEALAQLKKIGVETGNRQASDFLTDDALAMHQLARAESLLAGTPGDPQPQDPQLLKMATLYKDMGKPAQSMAVLDKNLLASPRDMSAMLFKADYQLQQGHYREAADIYRQAQRINPGAIRAWTGYAETRFASRRPLAAVLAIHRAQKLDPTDPYLRLLEARYVYENGNTGASAWMLRRWREKNQEPFLPVLLYHALTSFDRDPLLAYPINLTASRFEEHIHALQEAGFTPVTAEQASAWMYGRRELPSRPVMVTFDDARLNSFRYADPVLDRYGFKSAMFAAIINIEGRQASAFASWRTIEEYARTGRWEIQSHGDQAHGRIPIDARGREGLFLINRQWLEKEKRLETVAEWRQRVIQDHESSREKIEEHVGRAPTAYAFPAGTYGQLDTSNSPEAVPLNLAAVRRVYKTAYHQDLYGINTRARDPYLMTRVEPHQEWTGQDLVRHILTENPFAMASRQLARQSAWEGNPHQARSWQADLQARGFPPAVITAEEARLHADIGHLKEAGVLISSAAASGDPDPDIPKIAESIQRLRRPLWTPGAEVMADNRHRVNAIFHQEAAWPAGDSQWTLMHRLGSYHEQSSGTVVENAVGAEFAHSLGNFNYFSAQAMAHAFTAGAPDRITYGGSMDTAWPRDVKTRIEGGRSVVETAQALVAGITERYFREEVQGPAVDLWKGTGQLRWADLSDTNRRITAQAEASHALSIWLNIWGVYRFTFDDTRRVRPEYYSPQNNVQNQLGLKYGQRAGRLEVNLLYMPGLGSEKGTKTSFIQDVDANLRWTFSDYTSATASYTLGTTPTYRSNTYGLNLSHRF